MINLSAVNSDDPTFLHSLFQEMKEDEFKFLPVSDEQRTTLLTHQYNIQHHAYTSQYPQHQHFIISFQNQKIGQVRLNYTEQKIHLIDLSIRKQFQSKGIGTYIVRQLQQEASDTSKSILLYVYSTNPARRLYESLGFHMGDEKEPYIAMKWNDKTI